LDNRLDAAIYSTQIEADRGWKSTYQTNLEYDGLEIGRIQVFVGIKCS